MSKERDDHNIKISAPWGNDNVICQSSAFRDAKSAQSFIKLRSEVHKLYIVEIEKTKRISLVLSVILLLSAMLIVMFAPQGKEVLSYWFGAALVIFSAGAAGYRRLWAKAPMIEIESGQ